MGVFYNGQQQGVHLSDFHAADRLWLVSQPEHGTGGPRQGQRQYELPAEPHGAGAKREQCPNAGHDAGVVSATRGEHIAAGDVLFFRFHADVICYLHGKYGFRLSLSDVRHK